MLKGQQQHLLESRTIRGVRDVTDEDMYEWSVNGATTTLARI